MRVTSAAYGHSVTFLHARASPQDIHLVTWGPGAFEVYVPTASALDGEAELCFVGVRNVPRFVAWCASSGGVFAGEKDGACRVRVPGFSRWKYVDSEGESEGEEGEVGHLRGAGRTPARIASMGRGSRAGTGAGAPGATPGGGISGGRVIGFGDGSSDESSESDGNGENDPNDDNEESPGENGHMVRGRWVEPMRIGVDVPKLHRLRAALFEEEPPRIGEPAEMEDVRDDVIMGDLPRVEKAEHVTLGMFGERELDAAGAVASELAGDAKSGVIGGAFPMLSMPFPPLRDSVAAGHEGNLLDLGLMRGRSFRNSYGPHGLRIQTQFGVSTAAGYPAPGFVAALCDVFGTAAALPRSFLVDVLRVHCTAWKVAELEALQKDQTLAVTSGSPPPIPMDTVSTSSTIPYKVPSLAQAFTLPEVADATLAQLVEEFGAAADDNDLNAVHAQVSFWLLLALYKHGDDPGAAGEDNLLRRLTLWAAGPAGKAFDKPVPEHPSLRRALLLLTLGDLEGAVSAAVASGHLRLAIMISRALEAPKDDLRADAEAQLVAYGLLNRGNLDEVEEGPGDDILDMGKGGDAVSVDERMVLFLLAGRIAPVARFLGLSWYRTFIMELLHGAGSSNLTQAERVSAAVSAVTKSGISTIAPHGQSGDTDAAYHLLRLYADPTASYPLTSGVYSAGSFGVDYAPLDARFPWLLHQVLSAIVPQATTAAAPAMLADSFAAQLSAAGLPLWSFYVLCSGGAPAGIIKDKLIRAWPQVCIDSVEWSLGGTESTVTRPSAMGDSSESSSDHVGHAPEPAVGTMTAENFLVSVLGMPVEWLHEARAVACHASGDMLNECVHWIATKTEAGATRAHRLLAEQIFPEASACHDAATLARTAELLRDLSIVKRIANWSTAGGLILEYLNHVAGVPVLVQGDMALYRSMARRLPAYASRAQTPVQMHAAATVADGIASAERARVLLCTREAKDRAAALEDAVSDLEKLPTSSGVKLRAVGEYRIEAQHGAAIANRFASALPLYSKYLQVATGASNLMDV